MLDIYGFRQYITFFPLLIKFQCKIVKCICRKIEVICRDKKSFINVIMEFYML